jgi:hypothetical protein
MKTDKFDIDLAVQYGIDVGIVIYRLATYEKGALLSDLMDKLPFYSYQQLRSTLNRAIKEQLVSGEKRKLNNFDHRITYEITEKTKDKLFRN